MVLYKIGYLCRPRTSSLECSKWKFETFFTALASLNVAKLLFDCYFVRTIHWMTWYKLYAMNRKSAPGKKDLITSGHYAMTWNTGSRAWCLWKDSFVFWEMLSNLPATLWSKAARGTGLESFGETHQVHCTAFLNTKPCSDHGRILCMKNQPTYNQESRKLSETWRKVSSEGLQRIWIKYEPRKCVNRQLFLCYMSWNAFCQISILLMLDVHFWILSDKCKRMCSRDIG